tara:strand:- start:62 stop:670 length:609 start_codon:yes stop_codon:yes gene_type:complete
MILIKKIDSLDDKNIILEKINNEDLNQICKIYSQTLPSDALPNFGYDALKKYFEYVIENKSDIIIAEKEKLYTGFLVLTYNTIDLKKVVSFRGILTFILKSLLNPLLFIRLIFQIFRKNYKPDFCSFIHAFAVKKEFSSQGIGRMLINEAEILTKNKGYKGIFTKTHNEKLFKYYEKEKEINLIKKFKILNKKYYNFYWNID